MSELLPKIARITRLLPQEDGHSDHSDAARRLQKTDVAVTQPLSFALYTKIPATGERVNWTVQSGFPSEYFASHTLSSLMDVQFTTQPQHLHKHIMRWLQRINLTSLPLCPRAKFRSKPCLF